MVGGEEVNEPHVRGTPWCPCVVCQKHRLAYALLVARNQGNITPQDYDAGMMVLDTYLSMMLEAEK